MATCSNGHSDPKNHIDRGEFEASLVALNRGLLADSSTEGTSQEPQRSLLCTAWTRRLSPIAAGLFFVVIAAVFFVVAAFAISDSRAPMRGQTSSAPPALPSNRPDQSFSNDRAAGLIARPALQGTDLQGFLDYPGARCNSANPAVAIGRTSKSLIVICQNYAGRFYYKGLGLESGRPVEFDDLVRAEETFTASKSSAPRDGRRTDRLHGAVFRCAGRRVTAGLGRSVG